MLRRNNPTLDPERELFEKNQTIGLQKATSTTECAAKEKHVRTAILGTYQDNGAGIFWLISQKLPLATQSIVCWKFCHVLHKIIRDGHPNSLKDSLRHKQQLKDIAANWNLGASVYARLIRSYLKCLALRIDFHQKHPIFLGSLTLKGEDPDNYGDINSSFELCVDLLDNLDALIDLQRKVFSSLDMSRAVSVTGPGQCRLAPCILVILDTGQLYDHIVKNLFKLHDDLPSDALSGHRNRFIECFTSLKSFYEVCSNLIYFKKLINVPSLPDMPPDFLVKSSGEFELGPVQMLEEEEEEVEREPSPEPIVDYLVNMNFDEVFGQADNSLFEFKADERDSIIEVLKKEIERLKNEIELMQAENKHELYLLQRRIEDLHQDVKETKDSAANNSSEVKRLRQLADERKAKALQAEAAHNRMQNIEKKASNNEDIYKKLKEKHLGLVKDHADLLRKDAELQKLSASLQHNASNDSVNNDKLRNEIENLKNQLELRLSQSEEQDRTRRQNMQRLLDLMITQTCLTIRSSLSSLDGANDKTCTAESLMRVVGSSTKALDRVKQHSIEYKSSQEVQDLVQSLSCFGHRIAQSITSGAATCNMAPDDQRKDLKVACRDCGNKSIDFLNQFKTEDLSAIVQESLDKILQAAKDLLPKITDVGEGDLDDLVGKEMASTQQAVDQAAERIEALLNEARKKDSGVKLEVNERILDSCTELMKMIKILIASAKELQREIVSQGRGSSSIKEFYMKNSRWTEGLISAAKAVGWGATMLTDSADLVVQGSGKFEELLVWSHEISASTAQLVAASRVKSSNRSKKLPHLESSSRNVNSATQRVVSSTNEGRQQLESTSELLSDISNVISLTQIKRKEMDSQVKVLALEQALQQERSKLGKLRKKHYELADVTEFDDKKSKPRSSTTSGKPLIPLKPSLTIKPALAPKPVIKS